MFLPVMLSLFVRVVTRSSGDCWGHGVRARLSVLCNFIAFLFVSFNDLIFKTAYYADNSIHSF